LTGAADITALPGLSFKKFRPEFPLPEISRHKTEKSAEKRGKNK